MHAGLAWFSMKELMNLVEARNSEAAAASSKAESLSLVVTWYAVFPADLPRI
jgi:hypothetical protein